VITTNDMMMMAPMSELISAWRKSNGKTTSATAHSSTAMTTARAIRWGSGTAGSRFSTSSPRPGRLAPRQNIAITMITNTSSCWMPGSGLPLSVGNQGWVEA
jgi:hypothetical protein